MTTAEAVLGLLRTWGVTVRLDGGQVILNGPREVLTPELIESLRPLKPAIAALLRVDAVGRLHGNDGCVYAPTPEGGWVIVVCPGRRVLMPGRLAVN